MRVPDLPVTICILIAQSIISTLHTQRIASPSITVFGKQSTGSTQITWAENLQFGLGIWNPLNRFGLGFGYLQFGPGSDRAPNQSELPPQ